ncbi:MAG: hypothetical protein K8J09_22010 [Planctomycetes bacterium]|nr:hypothetical protein [Planctomycetota bacterium]MCC7398345.1 hypothetical protein [Planctomycetota bacterium]
MAREITVEEGKQAECKVGAPSERPGWTEKTCAPFDTITHTTHVLPAVEVLRTGSFEPRLVYDNSRLNEHRIPVVWLSPNHWTVGYRYGNVQFAFPFAKLLEGRDAYWVEIARYKIPVPRILLTEKDRKKHPGLTRYDPKSGDGPWWFDGTRHYFNSTVCVEFMVEGEVRLADVSEVGFVDHHVRYCCVTPTSPKNCRELGGPAEDGARRFLARVASEGVAAATVPFDATLPSRCHALVWRLAKKAKAGTITAADAIAGAVARATFAAIGTYRDDDAKALMALFQDEGEAETVCWRVLAAALGREVAAIQVAE